MLVEFSLSMGGVGRRTGKPTPPSSMGVKQEREKRTSNPE